MPSIKSLKKATLRFIARMAATFAIIVHGLRSEYLVANIAEGTHIKNVTLLATAAIATRYFLVKKGADAAHVAVSTATADQPIGVCTDEPAAAEDAVNVRLLGATDESVLMVANAAITQNADLYAAIGGKVGPAPTEAGTYWKVGRAMTAAAADGDKIEVESCTPVKVIVIAELGSVDAEIGGLTIGGTYSQSEVTAIATKAEEAADDLRALKAALVSAGVIITAA